MDSYTHTHAHMQALKLLRLSKIREFGRWLIYRINAFDTVLRYVDDSCFCRAVAVL